VPRRAFKVGAAGLLPTPQPKIPDLKKTHYVDMTVLGIYLPNYTTSHYI